MPFNLTRAESFEKCSDNDILIRIRSGPVESSQKLQFEDIKKIYKHDAESVISLGQEHSVLTPLSFVVRYPLQGQETTYVYLAYLTELPQQLRDGAYSSAVAQELFQATMRTRDIEVDSTPVSLSQEYLDQDYVEKARRSGHPTLHSYIFANLEEYLENEERWNPVNFCLLDAYAIALRAKTGDVIGDFETMKKALLPNVTEVYKNWALSGIITKLC